MMTPPCHLIAAWIALEDIGPDCGPLTYVPGSHRLPYFQFEPGQYWFSHGTYGDAEALAAAEWDLQHCRDNGLETETFTCRKGDVLLWHHSLLHGGMAVANPALSRRSFVVHYSTLAYMKEVKAWYGVGDNREFLSSTTIRELNGNHGFRSPLAS